MKNRKALLFSIVFGFIAVLMIVTYINRFEKQFESKYQRIAIAVAKKDIKPNAILDQTMFDQQLVPRPFVQPGVVRMEELADILSLIPVSLTTIREGEQLLKTKIDLYDDAKISTKIPSGFRACTIAVNDITGVGGHIQTGDHVDIIGTFRTLNDKTREIKDLEAVTLYQDVPILAVGRHNRFQKMLDQSQGGSGLFAQRSSGQSSGFNHVTLQTTPRTCMDLAIAQDVGNLTLALRSFTERNVGREVKELKTNRSTTTSVTGIEEQLEVKSGPKWLELRGEQGVFVP